MEAAEKSARPPKPKTFPFNGLPDLPAIRELQESSQWVAWDFVWKEDKQKWDKPPVNPRTGEFGSSTDPSTWTSYDRAARHVQSKHLAGVGYALTSEEERSGIDLDKCRDLSTGAIQPWAQIVVDFGETYTEVSPSGEGLRLFVRGKTGVTKNDAAHVEIYPDGRYLTITGRHIPGTPEEIREAPKTLAYLRERAEQFRGAEQAAMAKARETERKKAERLAQRPPAAAPTISERASAAARANGPSAGPSFWQTVNTRALANLGAWVPNVFPSAKFQPSTGAYRVDQRSLGENFEEDFSIHPNGIRDFGCGDMGDDRNGARSPITVVKDYLPAADAKEAAFWLCNRLGMAPADAGWQGGQGDASFAPASHQAVAPESEIAPAPSLFEARPFEWKDPTKIPLREWLLGRHLIRRFTSVTAAPGGLGKSFLEIADALAMATGRNLIGHEPHGRFRVLMWNGEDPLDELERRIMAACLHYEITEDQIQDYLFVNSGRDDPIVIAEQKRDGVTVAVPIVEAIKATIRKNNIDVVIIDPFVSCHSVNENDNGAIDRVAKLWGKIADETGCAIELVHHTRKTGGNETVMEDLRGAVALLSAVRSGRILNLMSLAQAEAAGVDSHKSYFRVDTGKANLAPPPTGKTTWFKLQSVDLGNGGEFFGVRAPGDSVGVVTAWEWPDPFENVTTADLRKAQTEVRATGPWRENVQAKDWVGKPIARALGLDPDDKADRQKIKSLLKTWIANGMFVVVMGTNEKNRPTPFVEVGNAASD